MSSSRSEFVSAAEVGFEQVYALAKEHIVSNLRAGKIAEAKTIRVSSKEEASYIVARLKQDGISATRDYSINGHFVHSCFDEILPELFEKKADAAASSEQPGSIRVSLRLAQEDPAYPSLIQSLKMRGIETSTVGCGSSARTTFVLPTKGAELGRSELSFDLKTSMPGSSLWSTSELCEGAIAISNFLNGIPGFQSAVVGGHGFRVELVIGS